jgi:hypothetical protein
MQGALPPPLPTDDQNPVVTNAGMQLDGYARRGPLADELWPGHLTMLVESDSHQVC